MTPDDPWTLWQLADSAFPSGGFAHSAGLEAAVASGMVRGADDLPALASVVLRQQARAVLPLMNAAHQSDDLDGMITIDALADAMLTSHVAHRASRAMGRALSRAAAGAFDRPQLHQLDAALGQGRTPGHLGPIFGYVARHMNIRPAAAAELFAFVTLRSLLSAAVRLGIVGPLHAQRLTHQLRPQARQMAELGLSIDPHDAADTAPMLTLAQTGHDRLYSRLFQS